MICQGLGRGGGDFFGRGEIRKLSAKGNKTIAEYLGGNDWKLETVRDEVT